MQVEEKQDKSGVKGRKAQREHYDPRAGKNKSNDRKLVKEGVRSKIIVGRAMAAVFMYS
jgi:hypothetical protein